MTKTYLKDIYDTSSPCFGCETGWGSSRSGRDENGEYIETESCHNDCIKLENFKQEFNLNIKEPTDYCECDYCSKKIPYSPYSKSIYGLTLCEHCYNQVVEVNNINVSFGIFLCDKIHEINKPNEIKFYKEILIPKLKYKILQLEKQINKLISNKTDKEG